MSSAIPAYLYESKCRAFLATTLSGLILCVFYPAPLQAVGGIVKKTDAKLAAAVIGNWEIPPSKNFVSFRKAFLTFNVDGTCKAIGITNDGATPRRVEVDAKWRVNDGYLIAEAIKTSPANRGIRLDLRDQIESIEDGTLKLRDDKGDKEEMRSISHLPSLPPLLTDAKRAASGISFSSPPAQVDRRRSFRVQSSS
jgi:hypothetical protein